MTKRKKKKRKRKKKISTNDEEKIVRFFTEHKNPSDEVFHEFIESMGYHPSKGEEFAYSLLSSFFSGGRSKGKTASGDEFKKGVKVEKEHSDSEWISRKIASDHIAEDPHYYTKLEKAE